MLTSYETRDQIAICAERLAKRYIVAQGPRHDTLRDLLTPRKSLYRCRGVTRRPLLKQIDAEAQDPASKETNGVDLGRATLATSCMTPSYSRDPRNFS